MALLAAWWLLPLSIAAVFAAIRLLRLSSREQSPLFATTILVLPWLPMPLPPAALLWTGPFMVVVWAAVVIGLVSARVPGGGARWFTNPRRAPFAAAALALTLYGTSAIWLSPVLPDGDEPHYLILAQSLIKDGDLRIENNHRDGDYVGYSLTAAAPDYLRRGVNGEIYSIHAPGLAVLIAPAMWLFGYPGVVAFLAMIAALSTALVWHVGFLATGSSAAAWFGWACCALTAPFFFQSTEVFPDGMAATCVLLGTMPLWDGLKARPLLERSRAGLKARPVLYEDGSVRPSGRPSDAQPSDGQPVIWILAGASLSILPWLQTRLAILALAAALCVLLRMRHARQLLAFGAVPAVVATAWFGFFVVVYGTPNPTAPYGPYTQTSLGNLVRGIPGLLFDQQFGLIPNAPVYGFVIAGVLAALIKRRRWSWETLILTMPYMMAVGSYQMWWGGTSVPARLLAPLTLVLGIAGARVWDQVRRQSTKTLGLIALIMSVAITATMVSVDHGRLLLNFRDGISLWLEYANDSIDLPKGLPSLFRDDRTVLWIKIGIWAAATLGLWIGLSVIESTNSKRPFLLSWPANWCAAGMVMIAFTLAWHVDGAKPLTAATAKIDLLRHASPLRPLAFDFETRQFSRPNARLSTLPIESDSQRRPPRLPAIFSARDLPAGTYEIRAAWHEAPAGALTARIGLTQLVFRNLTAADTDKPSTDARLQLPSGVRSFTIEGDSAAAGAVAGVEIVRVEAPDFAMGPFAHYAARYDRADTFFLDDQSYPEPTGFWVAGGRTAEVTLATHGNRVDLFLRNAPVANQLAVDMDGERRDLTVGPGEEQMLAWPQSAGRPFVRLRIRSRSGFRPSTTEPGSTDQRYLGCWVEVR